MMTPETREFFKTLYDHDATQGDHITFSTQRREPDGAPAEWSEITFAVEVEEGWLDTLATRMAAVPDHHDLYFCVTTKATPQNRQEANTRHLTTLWADFDRASSSAGKDTQSAWESLTEIDGFLFNSMGLLDVSYVVESGNGWHLYWVLDEPLEWGTDGEAEKLLARFGQAFQSAVVPIGKSLDSVWDAARVLRVPGTKNFKGGHANPGTVEIVSARPHVRISPSYLDDTLPAFSEELGRVFRSHKGPTPRLSPTEVMAWLREHGSPEDGEQGKKRIEDVAAAIRVADSGSRHASAQSALSVFIQDWNHLGIEVNMARAVEPKGELEKVWLEVKPDAERHEWFNMVRHTVARRVAEAQDRAASGLDISNLRRLTPEEEAELEARPKGLGPVEWPDPLPFSEREGRDTYAEFPVIQLPDVMREMVIQVARRNQAAVTLSAAAALASVSAVTAGGIQMVLDFDWVEKNLALWLVCELGPSERKSAVIGAYEKAIYAAQDKMREWSERDRADREAKIFAAHKKVKALESAKDIDIDALAEAKYDLKMMETPEPRLVPPFIIQGDSTPEAMVEAMQENNGVGFMVNPEGSFIETIAGSAYGGPRARPRLSNLNKGYSGDRILDRRSRGRDGRVPVRDVPYPHLVMLQFVQPDVVEQFADPTFGRTGFLSRLLFASPQPLAGTREVSRDSRPGLMDTQVADAWDEMILAVFRRGWGWQRDKITLKPTPEARKVLEEWHAECERNTTRLVGGDWWGKAHGHTARVAAVLQLAEDPAATQVAVANMRRAVAIIKFFAHEYDGLVGVRSAAAVGDSLLGALAEKAVRAIARRLARGELTHDSAVTLREMQRWANIRTTDEAMTAAEYLVVRGWAVATPGNRHDQTLLTFHPSTGALLSTDPEPSWGPKSITPGQGDLDPQLSRLSPTPREGGGEEEKERESYKSPHLYIDDSMTVGESSAVDQESSEPEIASAPPRARRIKTVNAPALRAELERARDEALAQPDVAADIARWDPTAGDGPRVEVPDWEDAAGGAEGSATRVADEATTSSPEASESQAGSSESQSGGEREGEGTAGEAAPMAATHVTDDPAAITDTVAGPSVAEIRAQIRAVDAERKVPPVRRQKATTPPGVERCPIHGFQYMRSQETGKHDLCYKCQRLQKGTG